MSHNSNQINGKSECSFHSTAVVFPKTIYGMLNNPCLSDLVRWLPHGRSFMMKLFGRNKSDFSKLFRNLSHWGFVQIKEGEDKGSYYHKYFQRDHPELLEKLIQSHKRKSQSKSTSLTRKPKKVKTRETQPTDLTTPMFCHKDAIPDEVKCSSVDCVAKKTPQHTATAATILQEWDRQHKLDMEQQKKTHHRLLNQLRKTIATRKNQKERNPLSSVVVTEEKHPSHNNVTNHIRNIRQYEERQIQLLQQLQQLQTEKEQQMRSIAFSMFSTSRTV